MADSTVERVVAEAALAKRFETKINERASLADIPALVEQVETFDPTIPTPEVPDPPIIAFDEDDVPYLTIGDDD